MIDTYASLHTHSHYSSAALRFPDAINKVDEMLKWCYDNGLSGMALTDHQICSGYVDLEQAMESLEIDRPFKHIFGNEFYTLSEEEDNLRFVEGKRPYYWHHLINVLDEDGLHQMYELSSRAWLRSYTYKGLIRRPSFYTDFEEVVGNNPGHLIASSACIGGYIPRCILNDDLEEARRIITWHKQVFGEKNFFLEVQPCLSDNEEQLKVNKELWNLHVSTDTPIIVTTDAHFMRPETRAIHTAFLKSKDGGDSREPEKFYQTTYFFKPSELREMLYNSDFTDEQIDTMFSTTNNIVDRVQPITLKKKTRVPALPSLPEFEVKHTYKDYYKDYKNIEYYANSADPNERYYYYQVEKGLNDYRVDHKIDLKKYLKQIDTEMEQVKGLGEIFGGERMADYFTVVQKVVDLIWTEGDSLVGIGRGSAGCYVTNKLLGITGIDPLQEGLEHFYPWWRFCSVARSDSIFDIDIDIQSFKKEKIIQAIKDYFGWRRVCQVVTWGRLTSKTSIERAGKGLGVPDDTINYIKSLIPVKRGQIYSIKDCLEGNPKKDRKKVPEFATEIKKYPGLLETALAFEGMIVSSGVHAGALNVLKGDFTETGAYMVSSNGAVTSQFDLHQAERCGDLKFDLLSIDCLEMIRSCLDLLLANKKMEWQGSLRDTYNHYLRYDVIEKDNEEMWNLLPNMVAAFQYDSRAGKEALNKIGAKNLTELTLANGLMRLAVPDDEQPMDKYVRYRKNIKEWYADMTNYGIPEEEQELLKELLGKFHGMMISQETMMITLMDKRVCNFSLKDADRARKAVAKKNPEALAETEKKLYAKGAECGRSKTFLDYLWNVQIEMSKSYAFAFCHSHEYSTECLQELNLYWKYGPIWWNTAVVITQSQTMDERENSANAIDYGKIAQSIYKAKENGIKVIPPYINKAGLSFTPEEQLDSILYGLGAIASINAEVVNQILSNRPYTSFNDFYVKNTYQGSLITPTKMIQLIKAGCFDEFNPDRVHIMKRYIALSTDKKTSLTMANMDEILRLRIPIPPTLRKPYNFKKYVCSKQFFYSNHPNFKSKKLYWLDAKAMKYFEPNCRPNLQEGVDFWEENDRIVVVDKALERLYKPTMVLLKEYINTPDFIKEYNKAVMRQKYDEKIGDSDPNKWSFQATSYYSIEHELAHVDFDRYNISKFSELPDEPEFIEKSWGKRTWRQYELSCIAGTVIAKNDNNHLITILTAENEVVNIKLNGPQYAFYKQRISTQGEDGKKKVLDESWFTRGSLLIVCGYRRGDSFVCKHYKSSIYQHSVVKIEKVYEDGSLDIISERYGAETEDN